MKKITCLLIAFTLISFEGEKGQITATSSDGDYKAIATQYDRKRFNLPNDLWPERLA